MDEHNIFGSAVELPGDGQEIDEGKPAEGGEQQQGGGAKDGGAPGVPDTSQGSDDDGAPRDGDDAKKLVPLQALHEERRARRELQARIEQQAQQQARLEERLQMLASAAQKPAETQPPPFEEDPAGHLAAQLSRSNQQVQAVQESLSAIQQQQQAQAIEQQMRMAAATASQQFMAQQPDYPEAYRHVREAKAREWGAMGYTPEQIGQLLGQAERQITVQALRSGANPAESLYRLAVALGYRRQVEPSAKGLDSVAKGASQKSLGSGGRPSGGLTLEALANMSDDEFASATAGGKWQKLLAGT